KILSLLAGAVVLVVIAAAIVFAADLFAANGHRAGFSLLPMPDGKTYGLSIVDDADEGGLERVAPVYEFLDDIGVKVTKTVWMFPAAGEKCIFNEKKYTLALPANREFVLKLRAEGHEIATHGATPCNDRRETIIRALDEYRALFGSWPRMNIDHAKNAENLYFGKNRLENTLYRFLYGFYDSGLYGGEDEKSPYFWGDIARKRIKYSRDWYFTDLNTLAVNPSMPYRDREKKYAPLLHSVTDAIDAGSFNRRLNPDALLLLKRDNGFSIVYTHFGFGYFDTSKKTLNPGFSRTMRRLAADDSAWIVPASDALDRFLLFKKIRLVPSADGVTLINDNPVRVAGVTILAPSGPRGRGASLSCSSRDCGIRSLGNGVFIVPSIPPHAKIALKSNLKTVSGKPPDYYISNAERLNCLYHFLMRAVKIRV
ncbi:MAG TPA: hypothetical protein PLQ76_03345, partial [bacterium]|nr:hypothetical protein [bacterium]